MRTLLLISSFVLFSFQNGNLDTIRNAFKTANTSQENAEKFKEIVKNGSELTPALKKAYLGASTILLSRYEDGIMSKYSAFKKGKNEIEAAFKLNPNNIEIRLVRLIIQHEVPAFLNYNDALENDKKYIFTHFSSANNKLQNFIRSAVKHTGALTPDEISKLK